MLYAANGFNFISCTSKQVVLFLEQIGRQNASYTLYILAHFPQFHRLNLYDVTLEDDSDRILTKFQVYCTRLRTVQLCVDSSHVAVVKLDALENPLIVAEAMKLVDFRLRAIVSLQGITTEAYENKSRNYIRQER